MDADLIVVGAGLADLAATHKLTRPAPLPACHPRLGTSDTATRPGNTGSVVVQRN
jgi:hypothetical protein